MREKSTLQEGKKEVLGSLITESENIFWGEEERKRKQEFAERISKEECFEIIKYYLNKVNPDDLDSISKLQWGLGLADLQGWNPIDAPNHGVREFIDILGSTRARRQLDISDKKFPTSAEELSLVAHLLDYQLVEEPEQALSTANEGKK